MAEFGDFAPPAFRFTGLADIAPMKDEPVMRALFPGIWHPAHKLGLDSIRCLARCHAGTIANPEDMCVDGNGRVSKSLVQHHIRRFPANSGKRLDRKSVV